MQTSFLGILGSCRGASRKPIIAKLADSRPAYTFRFGNDWRFERQVVPSLRTAPDRSRIAFDVDLASLAQRGRRPLSSFEADFIWLAVAVYLADRCAPRNPYGNTGPVYWRRRISLEIPVRELAAWQHAQSLLVSALEYLTEDDWSFRFLPNRPTFSVEMQEHLPQIHRPKIDWTSLFSGGLDSLAGALQWLGEREGTGLLVSGQTHNRIAAGQEAQIDELHTLFPQRVERVGISYGFPDKHRDGLIGFESTQRTRAFLHVTLGSVAALMMHNSQLLLFENGFGALNLPCDTAQFGSQNSRGTHPMFLQWMATLVSSVFSQPFAILNPFVFATKGQMVSSASVCRFPRLLQKSFSCDRFPRVASQCGSCPSCLIRRLSFHVAGVPDDPKNYLIDMLAPRRPLRESELLPFLKLSRQADTIGLCLESKEPWLSLCARWPDLLRAELELGAPIFRDSARRLLWRHREEWNSFLPAIHAASLAIAA